MPKKQDYKGKLVSNDYTININKPKAVSVL